MGVSEINKKKLKNITTIEKCLDKKSPYVQCFSIDTAQTNENEWVSGSEVRLKTCGGEKFRKGLWQKLLVYSKIAIFVCRAQQIEELGHYEN